jgi:serine phosphatase RsbU (regulator of sigma subunit)
MLTARRLPGRYVAAAFIDWRPRDNLLVISSAGAPSPIVCRRSRAERVQIEGFPIGLIRGAQYGEMNFRLNPGDLIVLASDGIVEACDALGEEYGYERLQSVISATASFGVQTVIQRISESVQAHTGESLREDDQTVVVLRIKEMQPQVSRGSYERTGLRLGHT